MTPPAEPAPGLLDELKRRKVVRAALVYGAAVFAVLQLADIVLEPLGLPAVWMKWLVWLALLGLPVMLVLAWFVDLPDSHRQANRWLSARTAVVVAVFTAVGVAGWSVRSRWSEPDLSPAPATDANVVAVLPFTALGAADSSYLSEAVAKLLSQALDGTAGLRTVSSHALFGYPGLMAAEHRTEALANEVAGHFGAGLWVMGDVLQSGDQLRIEATLASRSDPAERRVSAEVTSNPDELFDAVDRLAAMLLAQRVAGTGSVRTRTAATTTASVVALRAYVEGERSFRAGSYLPAVDAFTRAVQADGEFALAYYRLSMAQERLAWAEASRKSAETALQHAQRLSESEQEFLEAVVALRRGQTSDAEQRFRGYVRVHPDDPEAWYQLGEIQFHGAPLRGGSITSARPALEKALTNDPGDLGALYHLVRIAIRERDQERIDSLTARFVALSPGGERTLELRALQAANKGDEATFSEILSEMQESADSFLPIGVWSVATFGASPADAESIARLMTAADRPPDVRAAGQLQLAYLLLAQGKLVAALGALEDATRLGDPDAAAAAEWIAELPYIGADPATVASLKRIADARGGEPVTESVRPSSFFSAHNGVHDVVNRYLDGVTAARQGDLSAVAAAVAALGAVEGTEAARGLARQLAAGVQAQAALASGDTAKALEILSSLQIEGWYELTFVSPYFAGALERFTLAELLLAAGREQEALGWYQGLRENTVAELGFAGPCLLREAAIHRRAGREREAESLERQFAALWKDADPRLGQRVQERYGQ